MIILYSTQYKNLKYQNAMYRVSIDDENFKRLRLKKKKNLDTNIYDESLHYVRVYYYYHYYCVYI